MSEARVSIHDLPGGGIIAKREQDFRDLVDEYAERIQRGVDAAALDKAAGTLAGFGYVKVVRCRDCAYYATDELGDYCTLMDFEDVKSMSDMFCAWAVKRTG